MLAEETRQNAISDSYGDSEVASSMAFAIFQNDEAMAYIIDSVEDALQIASEWGLGRLSIDIYTGEPHWAKNQEAVIDDMSVLVAYNGAGILLIPAYAIVDTDDVEDFMPLLETIAQMYFQSGYKVGSGHAMVGGVHPHTYRSSVVGKLFNRIMFTPNDQLTTVWEDIGSRAATFLIELD